MTEDSDAITAARTATFARIDRMFSEPTKVGGAAARLFSPLLRVVGWQAKFATKAVGELLDGLSEPEERGARLAAAKTELERNLTQAERACAVHGYVPTAHASWLHRVADVLFRIETLDAKSQHRVLAGIDRTRVLPPLTLATAEGDGDDTQEPSKPEDSATGQAARLIELELAAIDHITEAARAETRFLERRRRLFEGARRLLLDASAALRLDPEGVRAREQNLAAEIVRVDRLQAAGVSPTVSLAYQAKQALRRGDREKLYAALVALDGFAVSRGDAGVAARTGSALDLLSGKEGAFTEGADASTTRAASLERSAEEMFGADVVRTLKQTYAATHRRHELGGAPGEDKELSRLALEYLAPGSETAALSALVSVDGCFEVGASLAPIRATEIEIHARLVHWPTPEMLLVHATEPADLVHAAIDDPRRMLMDLATGRLLTRRFVARTERKVERTRLVGEARIYVLDASGSMLEQGIGGSRARMRDAILIAELATMLQRQRAEERSTRLSFFYRFFTKRLGEVVKVTTPNEVIAAMGDIVGTTRTGGTDIQSALLSSFQLIRDARAQDPDLARASIVLVTDGQAPVDPELLRRAREEAHDVAIGVSVIALGEENPVLRDLVARQRARGERAFYHYVEDARLDALCKGTTLVGRSPHGNLSANESNESLALALGDVVVELEDLGRQVRRGATDADETEGARALDEAAARDVDAVARRYARWFPAVTSDAPPTEPPAEEIEADLEATRVVLASIAEVVGELAGDPLHKRADAIELIERLLPDARLTPGRYADIVASESRRLAVALRAVHTAVSSAEGFAAFDQQLGASRRR